MRFTRLIFAIILLLLMFTTSVSANSLNPNEVVVKAYDALVKGNINEYVSYTIDERFFSEEAAFTLYKENHSSNPLLNYEITAEEKINETLYKFTLKFEYKSGTIIEHPVLVKEFDGRWVQYISNEPFGNDEVNFLRSETAREIISGNVSGLVTVFTLSEHPSNVYMRFTGSGSSQGALYH
ncbi:hypothetical protein J2S11_003860 [Bacillus horti]|uniref:Uncharacterized protein n=2 Tax=Caldalkalibacillus horti TaxID=77523 RepID=A0ABT9W464_9BACI|nr:hypothetical protein [Bacillus horti]